MTSETKKLIKEIKEYYKVSDLSELNNRQWKRLSGKYYSQGYDRWTRRLTEEFMDMYADKFDWTELCRCQKMSEKFIKKHIDKIDWTTLLWHNQVSESFLEKYTDKLDWEIVCSNQKLSEPFIERYADKLNWDKISQYQKLSEHILEKFIDRINWEKISEYQPLSLNFIKKYSEKIDSKKISFNQNIDFDNIISNIKGNVELTDFFIKIVKENPNFKYFDVLKKRLNSPIFWKNYIKNLKEKYSDKNIFQTKFLDTITDISNMFGVDRNKLLNVINKAIKEKVKIPKKDK